MSRYILLILLFFSCRVGAQTSPELSNTLLQYREAANNFLSEMTAARKKPHSRVRTTTVVLRPLEIFDAVAVFNRTWKTDAALLMYFYQGGELKIFLADHQGLITRDAKIISRDSLLQLEIDIRNSLGVYRPLSVDRGNNTRGLGLKPGNHESDTSYIAAISALLINPQMAEAIREHDHLLILPALNLYSFPFAALQPYSDRSYLGSRVPITILPNLYEFCSLKGSRSSLSYQKIRKATIVGNPVFNRYNNPAEYYGRNKMLDEFFLEELPNTDIQTTAVRSMLLNDSSGRVRIHFLQQLEATLSNTLRTSSTDDLVYIATHGFSSALNPWDSSFIAFAREKDPSQPNLWSSRSIYNQNFRARLAVLSACQTGTGQLWDAGILSLANSFYYAGVDHVISTLWNVDDYFTSLYMRQFMKGFTEGGVRHPSYYLHLVQKSAKTSPRMWAGFVCFGK